MITKGKILSTPVNKLDNTFLVEIYLFKSAGDLPLNSKLDASKQTATLCISAGLDNNYRIGDIVYVAFEDNELSKPVIIGKLFTNIDANGNERKHKPVGAADLESLTVSKATNLPLDTVFESDTDKITAEKLLTQIREISNLQNQVSQLKDNPSSGLVFTNVIADNWVSSIQYTGYDYECAITCEGITEDSVVDVIFNMLDATSGNYGPVCKTELDTVIIYSKISDTIVIPTIKEVI